MKYIVAYLLSAYLAMSNLPAHAIDSSLKYLSYPPDVKGSLYIKKNPYGSPGGPERIYRFSGLRKSLDLIDEFDLTSQSLGASFLSRDGRYYVASCTSNSNNRYNCVYVRDLVSKKIKIFKLSGVACSTPVFTKNKIFIIVDRTLTLNRMSDDTTPSFALYQIDTLSGEQRILILPNAKNEVGAKYMEPYIRHDNSDSICFKFLSSEENTGLYEYNFTTGAFKREHFPGFMKASDGRAILIDDHYPTRKLLAITTSENSGVFLNPFDIDSYDGKKDVVDKFKETDKHGYQFHDISPDGNYLFITENTQGKSYFNVYDLKKRKMFRVLEEDFASLGHPLGSYQFLGWTK